MAVPRNLCYTMMTTGKSCVRRLSHPLAGRIVDRSPMRASVRCNIRYTHVSAGAPPEWCERFMFKLVSLPRLGRDIRLLFVTRFLRLLTYGSLRSGRQLEALRASRARSALRSVRSLWVCCLRGPPCGVFRSSWREHSRSSTTSCSTGSSWRLDRRRRFGSERLTRVVPDTPDALISDRTVSQMSKPRDQRSR